MTHRLRGPLAAVLTAAALAGAALAATMSFATPGRYRSSMVLRVPPARSIRELQGAVLNRDVLAAVIVREGLYSRGRARFPLEDMIDKMRADVEFQYLNSPGLYAVRFVYEDAAGAQRAARALLEKMSVPGLTVLSSPDLPGRPLGLTHLEMAGAGLIGGMLVALLACLLWLSSRVRVAASAALAGAGLAAAVWFALPKTYVSTGRMAVTRTAGVDRAAASKTFMSVWSNVVPGSLVEIVSRTYVRTADGYVGPRLESLAESQKRIKVSPVNDHEFSISVTDRDPFLAQRLTNALLSTVVDHHLRMLHEARMKKAEPAAAPDANLPRSIDGIDPPNMAGELNSLKPPAKFAMRSLMSEPVPQPAGLTAPAATQIGPPAVSAPASWPGALVPLPEEQAPEHEQFEVTVPPNLPDAPVSPNRLVVIGIGLAAGLLLGAVSPALRRSRASAPPPAGDAASV